MAAGTDLGSATIENEPGAIPDEPYPTTTASFAVVHTMTARFPLTRPCSIRPTEAQPGPGRKAT
jgi:hypothetical protein